MVIISQSSLLPDLSELQGSAGSENNTIIADFDYDNTNDEIDGAMKSFQKRFSSKRGKIAVIAYALMGAAAVAGIVINPKSVVLYFALLLCAAGIFYTVTDKKRTRKKIIEALDDMDPENYHCVIYPEKIELETIIKPENNEVDVKIDEEADEQIITPLKTVFKFGVDLLNFSENSDSLLLFFNRRQIYCFPKRCLSVEQQNTIRDFLTEKLEGEE